MPLLPASAASAWPDPLLFFNRAAPRADLVIRSERLLLRPPLLTDHADWAATRLASRAFLQPWEPLWPDDDLTLAAFRRRIRRYDHEIREDMSYPLFILDAASDKLMGGINLTNIRRGAAATASLGYWMGQSFAGKGYMTEAVRLVTEHARQKLGLLRIEAACLPENAVSLALLATNGFEREGFARRYLAINGCWRDHVLLAKVMDPDPR
jgi:[ribosomal protein S5]-alanine N-acetyltransferase